MLGVFLNHSALYFVTEGLSLKWEVSELARLASQQRSGSACLCYPALGL